MGSPACEASDALSPCAGLLARHRASSSALLVMLFEPGGATRPAERSSQRGDCDNGTVEVEAHLGVSPDYRRPEPAQRRLVLS